MMGKTSCSRHVHTYIIVHKGSSLGEDSCVVGECGGIDVGAVLFDMCAVVHDPAIVIDVFHSPKPVPSVFGVLRIRVVVRISGESGSEVEEASIGNC